VNYRILQKGDKFFPQYQGRYFLFWKKWCFFYIPSAIVDVEVCSDSLEKISSFLGTSIDECKDMVEKGE
jgi:hypothetical protein